MKRSLTTLALMGALAVLPACRADETVGGYGGAGVTWVLTEIDGSPAPARITLSFPEAGKLAGKAPCNSYFGAMTAPYPWFDASQVASTRRACPEMAAESAYLAALAEMTLSEVSGDVLVLSNDDGRELVFKAD